jgi:hypothetical protein
MRGWAGSQAFAKVGLGEGSFDGTSKAGQGSRLAPRRPRIGQKRGRENRANNIPILGAPSLPLRILKCIGLRPQARKQMPKAFGPHPQRSRTPQLAS